jgi:predicted component of type VI protein secretion system
MAYLIFSTEGQEWDRREMTGPMVLGRSADCEVSIHDILLSRRHCRFTQVDGDWLVIDLASRNGTIVGDHRIDEKKLKTGDVIRVGKTKITFRNEPFVPARHRPTRPPVPPAISRVDDTMAGTVFDLEFEPEDEPIQKPRMPMRPVPKPRPKDPESFATDDLYSMLEQIASSSWDSIYAINAQPLRRSRLIPQPIIAGQAKPRPERPRVSLALQAVAEPKTETALLKSADLAPRPARLTPHPPTTPIQSTRLPSQKPPVRQRLARLTRWISRVGTLRLF